MRRHGRALLLALLLGSRCLAAAAAAPVLVDDDTAVAAVFDRVAERLALMPGVAAAKFLAGAAITDPAREQAVLEASAAAAARLGLAPAAVRELQALQMRFARDAQQRLHAQWRQGGCDACAPPPRLQEIRARLDALGAQLLREVYVAAPALGRPDFVARHRGQADARLRHALPDAADRAQLLQALAAMRRVLPPGLARVRASGIVLIATTGDYEPFSLEAGGRVSGTDIDRGLALAARLGAEPVFVKTSWPTLLADLAEQRFDVALSGISVTPERAAAGQFSAPYHTGGKTILARCADRARLDSLAKLDRADVRVIVNPGGTNESYVREHLRHARLGVHPDNRTVFEEIVAGRADAMITDDIEAELQARRHPTLCRTLPGTLTRSDKAAFIPRDPALKAAVDAAMR